MAITYTLNITEMQVVPQAEGQTDVVVNVGWAYVGSDGTNTAAFGGTTPVTYTQGSAFTPYAELTQEQVAGWVLAAWGPEQTEMQQQAIAKHLKVRNAPLPWVGESA